MNTDVLLGAANLLVVGPYTIRAAGRERATWWRYGLYSAGVLAMVSGAAALRRAAASSGNTSSSVAGLGAGAGGVLPARVPDGYATWADYYGAQVASRAMSPEYAAQKLAEALAMEQRYEEAKRVAVENQAAATSTATRSSSTYGAPASELVAAAAEVTAAKPAAAMAPAGGSVIDISIPESPIAPPAAPAAPATDAAASGPLAMTAVLGQGGVWLLLAGIAYAAFSSRSSARPRPRRHRARR